MATKQQIEQIEKLAALHRTYRIPPEAIVEQLTKTWTDRQGNPRSMTLDYVGHAHLRDILCSMDPLWSWRPLGVTDSGAPQVDRDTKGWARGLWIGLTVYGVEKPGYGTCEPGKPDAVKELIGDALRNAAQSFGIAISLWAKSELAELEEHEAARPDDEPPPEAAPAGVPAAPPTADPAPPPAPPTAPAPGNGQEPSESDVRQELARLIQGLRGESIRAFQAYRAQQGLTGTDLTTITLEQAADMATFLRGQPVGRVAGER